MTNHRTTGIFISGEELPEASEACPDCRTPQGIVVDLVGTALEWETVPVHTHGCPRLTRTKNREAGQ